MPLPDLLTALNADATARINEQTPGAGSQNLWSTRDDSTPTYVWNAASLFATESAAGKLTSIGVFNTSNTGSGLLVSQQAFIAAAHWGDMFGATVRFVSPDGTVRSGVLGHVHQVPGTDIAIYRFNAPIHSSIIPAKLLPANYTSYFADGSLPPCYIYFTDQLKKIYLADASATMFLNPAYSSVYANNYATITTWFKQPVSGDSGNAWWSYIGGELVGLSTTYTGGAGGIGPAFATSLAGINAEIIDAGGSAADFPALVDLSGFQTYTRSGGGGGPPVSATITIKPAGGGDYVSIHTFLAALAGGTFGGDVPTTIIANCYPGNIGSGLVAADWDALESVYTNGNITLTFQAATAPTGVSDSNAFCTGSVSSAGADATPIGTNGFFGSLTWDGIQFGSSTANGRLTGSLDVGGTYTIKNCIVHYSQDAGAVTQNLINAIGGAGGTFNVYNNYLYIAVNQNASAVLRVINAQNTAGVLNANVYHNALCNKSTTGTITGFVRSYAGTLNIDYRYNASLGPNSSTLGFGTITTSGTANVNALSDYNVTSDTTGTTLSPGGHGVNSKLNTDAWGTLGSRTIVAGSVLAGLGTVTPVAMDCVGTNRPQQNLVDGGPFEIIRFPTITAASVPAAGTTIVITLSSGDCTPASGSAGITLGGTTATVTSWAISGVTLTGTLSGHVLQTETVTLTTLGTGIVDGNGNALTNVTGMAVTNGSTYSSAPPGAPIGVVYLGQGLPMMGDLGNRARHLRESRAANE